MNCPFRRYADKGLELPEPETAEPAAPVTPQVPRARREDGIFPWHSSWVTFRTTGVAPGQSRRRRRQPDSGTLQEGPSSLVPCGCVVPHPLVLLKLPTRYRLSSVPCLLYAFRAKTQGLCSLPADIAARSTNAWKTRRKAPGTSRSRSGWHCTPMTQSCAGLSSPSMIPSPRE